MGERLKKFITSWDDDNDLNYKLADLLKKYNIPAIFYLTSKCAFKQVLALKNMGFEIGGHTKTHPEDMKLCDHLKLQDEIMGNKKDLEIITGYKLTSFCYPAGKFNEKTVEMVKSAGYTEARTTNILNVKMPQDLFRIYATIHTYPNRKEYNGRNWVKLTYEYFDKVFLKDEGNYFHLWGHSWEVDKFNQWKDLETLFIYFKSVLKL